MIITVTYKHIQELNNKGVLVRNNSIFNSRTVWMQAREKFGENFAKPNLNDRFECARNFFECFLEERLDTDALIEFLRSWKVTPADIDEILSILLRQSSV